MSNVREQQLAVARLVRDLREVVENPLPNVAARPLDDNLFTWHGNVRGAEGPFLDVPIHFVLEFPPSYPRSPPECHLYTPVPHPNVSRSVTARQGRQAVMWRLALWDCVPSYDAWSMAYSVQSVLVQLQAFLLDDELQYNTALVSMKGALEQALKLKVSGRSRALGKLRCLSCVLVLGGKLRRRV